MNVTISYEEANVLRNLLSQSLKKRYEMLDRFRYTSRILADDTQKRINVEEKILSQIAFVQAVDDYEKILRKSAR